MLLASAYRAARTRGCGEIGANAIDAPFATTGPRSPYMTPPALPVPPTFMAGSVADQRAARADQKLARGTFQPDHGERHARPPAEAARAPKACFSAPAPRVLSERARFQHARLGSGLCSRPRSRASRAPACAGRRTQAVRRGQLRSRSEPTLRLARSSSFQRGTLFFARRSARRQRRAASPQRT